ncbi:MAG: nitrogenase component 1 [Anaeromyxobacteraceae bacterium]
MSSLQRTAPIREKRTGVISAFSGTVETLARDAAAGPLAQRVRTFSQDTPSDLQRALSLLRSIEGLGIVVDGPAGCAATLHAEGGSVPWVVTGLDQRDSIMGGDEKLRAAIRGIFAARSPRAIAVVATPVVAINNDDVLSATIELRDELGIPVFPVFADGFRSKVAATGHDVAVHALASHLLPGRHGSAGDHVTLLSIAEGAEETYALRALLGEVGIDSVLFPRSARVSELGRVASSRLSISIDPDEAEYAGEALRRLRGVPYLAPSPPIGFAGTTRWLAAVGDATGHAVQAAEVATRQSRRLAGALERTAAHAGARIFVSLPPQQALGVAELIGELGLRLAGIGLTTVAARHALPLEALATAHPGLRVLVGEGQAFEEVNLLASLKPDLYVGSGNAAVHALRLGVPVLDLQSVPILGYAGAERFAAAVSRRLAHPSFARFLAEEDAQLYQPGWLGKSTHWFIKHEVK